MKHDSWHKNSQTTSVFRAWWFQFKCMSDFLPSKIICPSVHISISVLIEAFLKDHSQLPPFQLPNKPAVVVLASM